MAEELPFRYLDVGEYFSQKDLARIDELAKRRGCSPVAWAAAAVLNRLQDSEQETAKVAAELAVALRAVLASPGVRVLVESSTAEEANTALKHAAELP